jgi:hypothetical protein
VIEIDPTYTNAHYNSGKVPTAQGDAVVKAMQ